MQPDGINPALRALLARMEVKLDLLTNEVRALRRVEQARPEFPRETLDGLREAVCQFIQEHYKEHGLPFNSGKISRVFSHRLRQQGATVASLLKSVIPDVMFSFVTEKGATMYLPKPAWDRADSEQRARWFTMTERDYYKLKEEHRRMIREFKEREAEIERQARNYRKQHALPMTDMEGLPELEEAFSDLTGDGSSDK
jgi:hypothetical protein